MFDSKTSLAARLSDAADLLIDFATLGEYGMEPVEQPLAACGSRGRPGSPQRARRRGHSGRSQGLGVRSI